MTEVYHVLPNNDEPISLSPKKRYVHNILNYNCLHKQLFLKTMRKMWVKTRVSPTATQVAVATDSGAQRLRQSLCIKITGDRLTLEHCCGRGRPRAVIRSGGIRWGRGWRLSR